MKGIIFKDGEESDEEEKIMRNGKIFNEEMDISGRIIKKIGRESIEKDERSRKIDMNKEDLKGIEEKIRIEIDLVEKKRMGKMRRKKIGRGIKVDDDGII